jgi:DNA repair exonuclease SbcCD ATPase subunit
MLVEIDFSVGIKTYKIRRGMKPNIFEIFCDGELINQESKSKDYQDYLEKYILRTNYKSFVNVVILGSARYTPFMSMTAQDRRSIIEELLDINIFSSMNTLVKEKIAIIKEQLIQLNYNIELTKEKLELQKNNVLDNKKTKEERIKKKREEIDTANNQIEEKQKEVEQLQEKIDSLTKKVAKKLILEDKKQQLLSIETKTDSSLTRTTKDIDFFKTYDNCPVCKQNIENEFKLQQIEKTEAKRDKLSEKMTLVKDKINQIIEKLNAIEKINLQINKHQSEIIRINASISATLKYIKKDYDEINRWTTDLVDSDIKSTDKRFIELNNDLETFLSSLEESKNEKQYYDFCSVVLKDGGIKTKIIKQYLPIINKLINSCLSQMNFFVNFNINENFEEIIKSRNRDNFSYCNFSEGEKTKIDLAILFAFRQIAKMKNSVNTNLLIMDEILDSSLDLEATDVFLDLIDKLDNNTNIMIISHRGEQVAEKFDKVLKFEKVKNFTRLQELK